MTKRSTATTHKAFHLFVTLGPIGYLPFAPGTYGSAFACIFVYLFPGVFTHPLFVAIFIVVSLTALNSLVMEEKDPSNVVVDEVAGMFVSMAGHTISFPGLLSGFVLFRFFDIVKPYPIRKVEALRKGYGILADDVVAGIFVNLILFLGRRMLP